MENPNHKGEKPYMVCIVGGTSSGKTTFTEKLKMEIPGTVTHFGLDNFYNGIPEGINPINYDFDHPSSLDWDYVVKCVKEIVETGETRIPIYDFKTHSRVPEKFEHLKADKVMIFEGILCLYDKRLMDLFDLKIFIHCDPDIALGRRILRDIAERVRDVTEELTRYNKFVKPDFQKFVKPQMKMVDLIIPGGASNDIALQFVIDNILNKIKQPAIHLQEKPDFQRIANSRKLSVNTINKIPTASDNIERTLGKIIMDNHIPFSRELRSTSRAFFSQIYSNPNSELVKMNMKFMSEAARSDIVNCMCVDFQMGQKEVMELGKKVQFDEDLQKLDAQSSTRQIFVIR